MNEHKKKRKLSPETRLKISLKRRARAAEGNNPRKASQSTKRKSLAEEMLEDYRKNPEAVKWIKEHMTELGYRDNADEAIAIARDWGIQTEYNMMHPDAYEAKVGEILYSQDNETFKYNEDENDWIDRMDNEEA